MRAQLSLSIIFASLFVCFDNSINPCPYIPPKKISVGLKMRFVNWHDISFDGKHYVNPLR